ncbi:MAG: hypothetical protein ACTSQZ_07125, partial [Candidatus Thorarchaeota archaeon]
MDLFPILVDGAEIDTGKHVLFPDMDKVIVEPGLAIALQLQSAPSSQRFIFSKIPGLIPSKTPEMRYLKDYRQSKGVPKYSK